MSGIPRPSKRPFSYWCAWLHTLVAGCLTCLQSGKKHLIRWWTATYGIPLVVDIMSYRTPTDLHSILCIPFPKTTMALFGQIQLQDYASPVFEATIWCNWPVIREGWAGIGGANSTGFFLNAGIILFRDFFFPKKTHKKKRALCSEKRALCSEYMRFVGMWHFLRNWTFERIGSGQFRSMVHIFHSGF